MNFTKELVDKFAKDLLISLTEEENQMVLNEFSIIEKNMNRISKMPNIKEEEMMTHPFAMDDVYIREDEVFEELSKEDVLKNAKEKTMDEIVVVKVVENE